MAGRSYRGAARMRSLWILWITGITLSLTLVARGAAAQAPPSTAPSAPAEAPASVPMDLKTGKVDTTPLAVRGTLDESNGPMSPPQTVEGTLVSVDPSGRVMTVRTKRDGDVKVGLPPDIPVSRSGHDSTVADMHPGDSIFATVETGNGVRAIRLVSQPPMNPLINYIGIPLLLIIAFIIWWTGRGRDDVDKPGARPTGRPVSKR